MCRSMQQEITERKERTMLQQNNQMKRQKGLLMILAIILIAMAWACAASHTVWANEKQEIALPAEGGNIYFNKETGTITGCDKNVTEALIPKEIDGAAVTHIGYKAFYGCAEGRGAER